MASELHKTESESTECARVAGSQAADSDLKTAPRAQALNFAQTLLPKLALRVAQTRLLEPLICPENMRG